MFGQAESHTPEQLGDKKREKLQKIITIYEPTCKQDEGTKPQSTKLARCWIQFIFIAGELEGNMWQTFL